MRVQKIAVDLDKAWYFFSDPANLASITPDTIAFKTTSKYHGPKMYAGQIIEYKVKPVLGIAIYWMTEITHVEDKKYFVDEQRFGPFKMWHHQHHFSITEGGVQMTDILHYKLPLWFLGDIANWLFVRRQVKKIFDFREKKIGGLFRKMS